MRYLPFGSRSLPERLAWTVLCQTGVAACLAAALGIWGVSYLIQEKELSTWRGELTKLSPMIAAAVKGYNLTFAEGLNHVLVTSQPLVLGAEIHHKSGVLVSRQGVTSGHDPSVIEERLPLKLAELPEVAGFITIYRQRLNPWAVAVAYLPGVAFFIVLLSVTIAWAIYRHIHTDLASPLQQLSDQVADYNLHQQTLLPLEKGASEVVHLSLAFNQMAARIRQLALHDPVAELPNRLQLDWQIRQAQNSPENPCTLFLMDLDHFKSINDNFGHDVGDDLLRQVAERVKQLLPAGVQMLRMGGDEFVLWQPNSAEEDSIERLSQRVLSAFEEPFALCNGVAQDVQTSVGVALYPRDVSCPSELLKAADLALYHTKAKRSADVARFTPSMRAEAREWMEIANALKNIQRQGQSLFAFQPIVYVASEKIWGYEMLLRLPGPNGKVYSPERVLKVASQTKALSQIMQTTIEYCIDFLKNSPSSVSVTFNLSPQQLKLLKPGFVEEHLLKTSLLMRSRITIELTEQDLLEHQDLVDVVENLHSLKFRFALDDFGSGYTSLNCLTQFPVYLVKLDKALLHQAQISERSKVLFQAVVSVAKELGLLVLIEGVELAQQMAMIKKLECDFAQGYFLGKPIHDADYAVQYKQAMEK